MADKKGAASTLYSNHVISVYLFPVKPPLATSTAAALPRLHLRRRFSPSQIKRGKIRRSHGLLKGNMDRDVRKKMKGNDGHTVPVLYTGFQEDEDGMASGNIRDEKQLKREKRKLANRESAWRSRMRKQAEYEELVKTCDSLSSEQTDLKSELDRLKVAAGKLRLENAALKEQLQKAHILHEGGNTSPKSEGGITLANNILGNLGTVSSDTQPDCQTNETSMSETITRLNQLLESSSRTDAVAAR